VDFRSWPERLGRDGEQDLDPCRLLGDDGCWATTVKEP
jgi:hypothetical protein